MNTDTNGRSGNFRWSDVRAWLVVGTLFGMFMGLLALSGYGLVTDGVHADQTTRKLKSGEPPEYPELARRMKIKGVARIQATVTPEGSVKEVKELGGNPVLVESLVQAVKKWKYMPAPSESIVEIKFEFNF